ncbi:MAG: helix-turn-helix domain-containing protein [Gemmatimonadales bacterium]
MAGVSTIQSAETNIGALESGRLDAARRLEPLTAPESLPEDGGARTLEEIERAHVEEVLRRTAWKVSGPEGAAQVLGLKPTTLESRMKKLGIHRPR